jgi:3-phenylpropionate/trans-cinnamate dioxygenase ferredoxin subunit
MIEVCRVEDIPEGTAKRIETSPPIAVFHSNGEFFAIDDTCTHQDAALSEGWVENCIVECPLHRAQFNLRDGMPQRKRPTQIPVRTHEVIIEDGVIKVVLNEPAAVE